jgi:hypothetical protein
VRSASITGVASWLARVCDRRCNSGLYKDIYSGLHLCRRVRSSCRDSTFQGGYAAELGLGSSLSSSPCMIDALVLSCMWPKPTSLSFLFFKKEEEERESTSRSTGTPTRARKSCVIVIYALYTYVRTVRACRAQLRGDTCGVATRCSD